MGIQPDGHRITLLLLVGRRHGVKSPAACFVKQGINPGIWADERIALHPNRPQTAFTKEIHWQTLR